WKSTMSAVMAICVPSVIYARKNAIFASTALPNSRCCPTAECQATEGHYLGRCIPRPQLCTLDVLFHIGAAGRCVPKDFLPDFLTLHAQIEPGVCGIAPYPGEHFRVHLGTQGFEVAHFAISPWDEFRIHQATLGKALPHNVLQGGWKAQAPHTHIRHISWWYSVKNLGDERLVVGLPARVVE